MDIYILKGIDKLSLKTIILIPFNFFYDIYNLSMDTDNEPGVPPRYGDIFLRSDKYVDLSDFYADVSVFYVDLS